MDEKILLEECPICRGAGMIMHEGGWSVQVECCDCSAHTIYMEYNSEEEKKELLPSLNRDYSDINSVEEFRLFIEENSITSRIDFYHRFRNFN